MAEAKEGSDSEELSPKKRKAVIALTAKLLKQMQATKKLNKQALSAATKAKKAFDEVEDEAS